jgi:RNA-directed DNA polymerase
METQFARITAVAKQKPEEKFTSLVHLINEQSLAESHAKLKAGKASGIDKVTKEEYGRNLETNVRNLVERMKTQAYKPQAARRVYIPKPGKAQKRPLGIPSYEDKLVQKAMAPILNAIYEADFLDCSYGFRSERGCHDALKVLGKIIETKPVNYIVEADIKGFFDNVDHDWMMKFLAHRIADNNLLRLIRRFLKAGIMEAGIKYDTPEGTPQGGVISPILANVYLHYALDLWFEKIFTRKSRGKVYLVRYCDDFVVCCQYRQDAEAFMRALKERLGKFNLEIAEDKTRILEFGRFAANSREKKGGDKPDTFDFLGFTHYCSLSEKGRFRVKRKTSRIKFNAGLKRCKHWLRSNLTLPIKVLMPRLRVKVLGHFRYYGVTDNYSSLSEFSYQVRRQLYWWCNRRSQGKHYNWRKFNLLLKQYQYPAPKVYVNAYDIRPELLGYLK